MKSCTHVHAGVSLFVEYRSDGCPYEPTIAARRQPPAVSWRCAHCGNYASLGPANDSEGGSFESDLALFLEEEIDGRELWSRYPDLTFNQLYLLIQEMWA